MRVAVVDVAAESGGALSVLRDFLNFLATLEDDKNEYYVFLSTEICINKENIHYIVKPQIKNSWFARLKWERLCAIKEFEKLKIDVIFSLQNTAFYSKKIRQIVYFHNVLLLEPRNKYSLFKKDECLYGMYTRLIAPYTLNSFRYADSIVCQTNTVKNEIQRRMPELNVIAVYPNVNVNDRFIQTAVRPIKGYVYPTAPVPFKRISEVVRCVRDNVKWFTENKLELLITIDGKENAYAQKVYDLGKDIPCVKFIGYQTREEILQLYRDHALIINSELESFPIPYKEAELVGAPIVTADYPYAIEVTEKINVKFIFAKDDLLSMKNKMIECYESKDVNLATTCANSWDVVLKIIEGECV